MVQVIFVVVGLRYRIIEHRIRKGKPSDDVRSIFTERFKVYRRQDNIGIVPFWFCRIGCRLRGSCLLRYFHISGKISIGIFTLSILVQVTEHQKTAAKSHQNAE